MAQTPNLVSSGSTPMSGLISTNPFLNIPGQTGTAKATTIQPSFGASSNPTGYGGNPYAPNPTLPGTGNNSGSTSTFASPSNSLIPANTASLPAKSVAYTLNGVNYDAGGSPVNTTASTQTSVAPASPIVSGGTGGGTPTPPNLNAINAPNMNANGTFINDSGSGTGATTAATGSGTSGVPTVGSAASGLIGLASTQSAQYQQAQANYQAEKAQLASLQTQAAQAQGSVQNTPGLSLEAATGQSGQIQNTLANMEAPISTEMTADQAAAQNATQQQSTQQSGYNQAGGLVSPQTQYGALTSPVTGQPISSSGVVSSASSLPAAAQSALSVLPTNGQNAVMLEAQKVANNQEDEKTAMANLSAYGQTGVTALNAILGSGFNANTNAGASAAQQSNVSTAGTASTTTNAGIYQSQLTSAAGTLQQAQAIQSSGAQLINTMTSLGINPTDPNIANKTINQLASQFSSPAYATFNANIANLQAKVSSLLSAGEIPTTASGAAQQIIDGSMSVSGLSAAITQINTEASQLAASQLSTATTAYQNLQSGNNGTTNTSAPSPYH